MYFGGIRIMKQGKKKDDYSFEFLYDKSKKSKSGKNTDMNMLLIMKIVNYRG